jgi:predicted kinase
MPKLVITRGLPGSGKTTHAVAWVAEDPAHRARITATRRA